MVFLIHPLLVHFPVALLLTSGLFDAFYLRTGDQFYVRAARVLIALGLLGAIVAIVSGFRDFWSFKPEDVGPAFAARHMPHQLAAYAATIVYGVSFWMRRRGTPGRRALAVLMTLGAVLIGLAGHLGGIVRAVM